MPSIDPEELVRQARSEGIVLDSVTPKLFSNSGIGIVATKDIDEGHRLISVPITALKTEYNVSDYLRQTLDGISVQGLLAIDFMLDESPSRRAWKLSLPSKESLREALPYWWGSKAQRLLPDVAGHLLAQQKENLGRDWNIVFKEYPKVSKGDYDYFWFLVNSRTFYYVNSTSKGMKDHNDCLALIPFADYFNHSSNGCRVTFSAEGYNFIARHKIKAGEEVFISYGAHGNDFLLAEYGFILEDNEHDTVSLDSVLTPLFNPELKAMLEASNFWADYVLDANGTCYRTEVAIRLLCMPRKLWLNTLEHGFDATDPFQPETMEIMQKCLKRYIMLARKRLDQVAGLEPRFAAQRQTLKSRWEQILRLVLDALAAQRVGM